MTLAGRDSGDLSLTFRDLKSFGARLSDLSRTLAGDPKMRVSDLKLSTLNVQLPVREVLWTFCPKPPNTDLDFLLQPGRVEPPPRGLWGGRKPSGPFLV